MRWVINVPVWGEEYRRRWIERGYPAMNVPAQQKLVRRLKEKITRAADDIALWEEQDTVDAEVVVVSYGITSRVAQRAIPNRYPLTFKQTVRLDQVAVSDHMQAEAICGWSCGLLRPLQRRSGDMHDVAVGKELACPVGHLQPKFAQLEAGQPPVQHFRRIVHFAVTQHMHCRPSSHGLS